MDDDKLYVPNRLEIKPGAYYFVAKCPNTEKILAIERDPDRGSTPYSHADTLVSCHHCQGRHRFETSDIIPCQASEGDDCARKPRAWRRDRRESLPDRHARNGCLWWRLRAAGQAPA